MKKIIKFTIVISVIVIVVVIINLTVLFSIQERLIFKSKSLNKNFRFPKYVKEIYLKLADGCIVHNVLLRNRRVLLRNKRRREKRERKKTLILILHGIKANVVDNFSLANLLMLDRRNDIFIHDYRGYGKSNGSIFDEKQLINDCIQVYKYLLTNHNYGKIFIYGKSLGTFPAVFLSSMFQPDKLLLETPYRSMYEVVTSIAPFVDYIPNLLKYHFPSIEYISTIFCPIYIFHGYMDELIPIQHSFDLYNNVCHQQKKLYTYKTGNHSNLLIYPEFKRDIILSLMD